MTAFCRRLSDFAIQNARNAATIGIVAFLRQGFISELFFIADSTRPTRVTGWPNNLT
jgi:hypothetical protein